MYHLGVDTTRALSLVVSDGGEMAERPWYSDGNRDRDPVPRQRRDRKGGGRWVVPRTWQETSMIYMISMVCDSFLVG